MTTIVFNYNNNSYIAAVREKYYVDAKEYQVKIMNNELDRLLEGDNIFMELEGMIDTHTSGSKEKQQLQKEIMRALNQYIMEGCIF